MCHTHLSKEEGNEGTVTGAKLSLKDDENL